MILLSVYILLIIINFKFSKSKIIFWIDFLFMWVLMGWNHSVADYSSYYIRYTNPEIYGTLEPLYVIFQNTGKMVGLDYSSFQIVMAFIFLFIRMIAIRMLSTSPNFVVGLYLLFPFIMDITQLRMFYATSIILLGIVFLLKRKKIDNIIFILFVILATMIHAACICYLLLLIPVNIENFNIKAYLRIIIIMCLILFIMLFSGGLYELAHIISSLFGFGTKFIETVFAAGQAYKTTNKIVYMLIIFLFFFVINLIFKKARKRYKLSKNENQVMLKTISKNGELVDICYKINYTLLIILPFAWFTGDIYRIQHGVLILFYSAFSNMDFFKGKKHGSVTLYQIYVTIFIVLYVFLFLVGISSLRESVFLPVFYDNILFG